MQPRCLRLANAQPMAGVPFSRSGNWATVEQIEGCRLGQTGCSSRHPEHVGILSEWWAISRLEPARRRYLCLPSKEQEVAVVGGGWCDWRCWDGGDVGVEEKKLGFDDLHFGRHYGYKPFGKPGESSPFGLMRPI